MVRRTEINKSCLISFVMFSSVGFAADITMTPNVEGGVTYTDNVDFTASDEHSSEIMSLTAGLEVEAKGSDGNASLDYSMQQLYYSNDSEKNGLFHELSLEADKGLAVQNRIRGDISASISNIASDIVSNASNDISRGDTIESREATLGLSYQSNPDGAIDMNVRIEGAVEDYEDNIGDNNRYSGDLYFSQGRSVTRYFWITDYSYQKTVDKSGFNDTESSELDQEIGLQPEIGLKIIDNWSPYLHLYYEDYTGQGTSDSADSSSWGPGVKYYLDKNSYISIGYDFALDDENSDHWRGSVVLIPTDKTQIEFEYTQRFYGDAYDFSLTHSNRRWTNSIRYSEEVTNYDRDLFVEGNRIEDLSLSKTLTWNSVLKLRRTTFNLDLSADKQKAINTLSDDTAVDTYSGELSITHNLSRNTTITPSFLYEYYDFQQQGNTYQTDYYRELGIELEHDFTESLSTSLELTYKNRSSSNLDSQYEENRIYFNVRKEL